MTLTKSDVPYVSTVIWTGFKKTYLLISLQEIRNRGDIDKFNIEWRIRGGFTRKTELWETEVGHRDWRDDHRPTDDAH